MSLHKPRLNKCTKLIAAAVLIIVTIFSIAIYKRNEIASSQVTHLSLETIAPLPELKVGDLIFRMGVGTDSFVIADITNSKYSHMGIISSIEPEILVTHATTADDAGSNFEGVITIPLKHFVSEASSLAIGRYQDLKDSSIDDVQAYLKSIEGQPFTITPDPNSIYCSSMVVYALQDHVKMQVEKTLLNIPLNKGEYYVPQAFIDDPNLKIIYVYAPPQDK